ncbi:hypothetical protein [Nocardiopsis sp. CC223A]|uniref:hypothetical protein n=1 Tax=Nocardiopsis sp. CC223A TaxID=3044051 RepID=UPI00278BFC9E|nr:hypothetical protein [Nocardiopsis sp. CC223A]
MGKAAARLERFVRARVDEAPPGDPVARSHRALIATLDGLREEASAEEDGAWVEAVAGWFGGWFDDDSSSWSSNSDLWNESAERTAAAIATRVLACMALVHRDHPDYDPVWEKAAPAD